MVPYTSAPPMRLIQHAGFEIRPVWAKMSGRAKADETSVAVRKEAKSL
jgi:hypothetical protein